MREILFRSKRKDFDNEWLYGFYTLYNNNRGMKPTLITCTEEKCCILLEVIPETVGQYTGLTDKNGKKIFEGDIVKTDRGKVYEIKMRNGCWVIWNEKARISYDKWDFLNTFAPKVEVIGNLHDNPETILLKNF